mgnify:CR=1 FL=1
MLEKLAPYRKTVTAVVTGLLGWVAVVIASASAHIVAGEWYMLATVVAAALGVYQVTNKA